LLREKILDYWGGEEVGRKRGRAVGGKGKERKGKEKMTKTKRGSFSGIWAREQQK